MEQKKVIERIKDVAEHVLPQGASLWLYGSRARGDARPDSDYDLLILRLPSAGDAAQFSTTLEPLGCCTAESSAS